MDCRQPTSWIEQGIVDRAWTVPCALCTGVVCHAALWQYFYRGALCCGVFSPKSYGIYHTSARVENCVWSLVGYPCPMLCPRLLWDAHRGAPQVAVEIRELKDHGARLQHSFIIPLECAMDAALQELSPAGGTAAPVGVGVETHHGPLAHDIKDAICRLCAALTCNDTVTVLIRA